MNHHNNSNNKKILKQFYEDETTEEALERGFEIIRDQLSSNKRKQEEFRAVPKIEKSKLNTVL